MNKTLRAIYLIDDGWRYEKRRVIRGLLEAGWDVTLVTHDPKSAECLRAHFQQVVEIPVHPPPAWRYYPAIFFSRDLGTHITRNRQKELYDRSSLAMKGLFRFRDFCKNLGMCRRRVHEIRNRLYRGSRMHEALLRRGDLILFSPVGPKDQRILHEAKEIGIPVLAWIYSWDNPVKDNEFFLDADSYAVWNPENVGDLQQYQEIPMERIRVTGPVHYDPMLKRFASRSAVPKAYPPHVLYVCALGREHLVAQEVELILWIREKLNEISPETLLKVRPYPFRVPGSGYDALEGRKDIKVLHFGQEDEGRILMEEEEEDEKFAQIEAAACMINLGSTMGLEAAFTPTPILQFRSLPPLKQSGPFAMADCLYNEHLRHMLSGQYPNYIEDGASLVRALRNILEEKNVQSYQAYSEKLRKFVDPFPEEKPYLAKLLAWLAEGASGAFTASRPREESPSPERLPQ
jgi:hypothetical protein